MSGYEEDEDKKKRRAIPLILLLLLLIAGATASLYLYSWEGDGDQNGGGEEIGEYTDRFAVTFDSRGGSFVAPSLVCAGDPVGDPGSPYREGYSFSGWFKDSSGSAAWDFGKDLVESDTTLYAKWSVLASQDPTLYAVSFDAHGGPAIPSITDVEYGARIAAPPTPAMEDHSFLGWYKDAGYASPWDFHSDRVQGDTVLHAQWERDGYSLILRSPTADGVFDLGTVLVKAGETYDISSQDPSRPDTPYTFGGWFTQPGGSNEDPADADEFPRTGTWPLASGLALYAYWKGTDNVAYAPLQGNTSEASAGGVENATGDVVIEEYHRGVKVTEIREDGFKNKQITSLHLPGTLKTIHGHAFDGCSAIGGTLYIPPSVTAIRDLAFLDCSGLTGTLAIPSSVTAIGMGAFWGCYGLTSLDLPSSLTTIEMLTFYDCYGLIGTLTIPSSVTAIRDSAFDGCYGLTALDIPSSVTVIERTAFYGCRGLTGALTIPSSMTVIGFQTFLGCYRLTSVDIPASVTTIEGGAFWGCYGLTSLDIPSSVTSIGDFAFADCQGLTGTLTIPSSVTTMGECVFDWCPSITIVVEMQEPLPPGATVPPGWDANWLGDCLATVIYNVTG